MDGWNIYADVFIYGFNCRYNRMKIQGSSIRHELVICAVCKKEFCWLKCYPENALNDNGKYLAICRKCNIKIKREARKE